MEGAAQSCRWINNKQEEYECGTSTEQVQDKLCTDNANAKRLIAVIGNKELSVKSMTNALELKGRDNFLNLYLKPAIGDGYVCLLYPNSPHHPRQKYLLTVKGLAVYDECAFYVSTQEKLEVFCCSFEKNVLLRMCIQQQMRMFSMSH